MSKYLICIFNGFDVDDYYIVATSEAEAIALACYEADCSVSDVYSVTHCN